MKKFICPLEVWLSQKKKIILNLNWYRNAHYQELNKAKVILAQVLETPDEISWPIEIEFFYYAKTQHLMDVSNPVAIIEKFVCDTLVTRGLIPDDNRTVVLRSRGWNFMGVDKENPRCEIVVYEKEDLL